MYDNLPVEVLLLEPGGDQYAEIDLRRGAVTLELRAVVPAGPGVVEVTDTDSRSTLVVPRDREWRVRTDRWRSEDYTQTFGSAYRVTGDLRRLTDALPPGPYTLQARVVVQPNPVGQPDPPPFTLTSSPVTFDVLAIDPAEVLKADPKGTAKVRIDATQPAEPRLINELAPKLSWTAYTEGAWFLRQPLPTLMRYQRYHPTRGWEDPPAWGLCGVGLGTVTLGGESSKRVEPAHLPGSGVYRYMMTVRYGGQEVTAYSQPFLWQRRAGSTAPAHDVEAYEGSLLGS